MIIDVHAHMYSNRLAPPFWIEAMARYGSAISTRTPDEVRERMEREWFDESGDLLVEDMDAAGIDKSVVFALDFGPYAGVDDEVSLRGRLRLFRQAVDRHPDRIVLFGGIDPRRPDAVSFVQFAADEMGVRGIKIWPPAGVHPNARYCYRVYEKCAELGLPVVIHTGQEISPMYSESARPSFCDQPANDFPELTFVLAHAGMGWWEEAAEMAWHHPNVHVDIAYWQAKYLRSPSTFAHELRQLISISGRTKVMFGSDWPALRLVKKAKQDVWLEVLRGLSENPLGDVEFEREEIDLLLGRNAATMLKLE